MSFQFSIKLTFANKYRLILSDLLNLILWLLSAPSELVIRVVVRLACPVIRAWALPSFIPGVGMPYPHLRHSLCTPSSISTMVMWYTDVGTIQLILMFKQNFSLRNVGSTYLSVLQWCGQLVKLLCSFSLRSACAVELRLVAFETVSSAIELFALLQQPSSGVGRLTVEVYGSHIWQVDSGKWSARWRGRCLHKIKRTQETNIHAVRGFRTRVPAIKQMQTYA